MRQSKLDFGSPGTLQRATDSASPQPESPLAATNTAKLVRREPVRQAFNRGNKDEGHLTGGEDVSDDSDDDPKLTAPGNPHRRTFRADSGDTSVTDSDSLEDDDEDTDSEEMLDLEAEDDEDYQSGDSLDEDDGGNSRKRNNKKKRNKGKAKAVNLDDSGSDVQIVTAEKKAKRHKRRVVESDGDDDVMVGQPVASGSRTADLTSPSRRKVRRQGIVTPDPERSTSCHSTVSPSKRPLRHGREKSNRAGSSPGSDSDRPVRHTSSSTKKSKTRKRTAVPSSSSSSSSSSSGASGSDRGSDSGSLAESASLRHGGKRQTQKRSRPADSNSPRKKRKATPAVKRKLKKLSQGTKNRESRANAEIATSDEDSFVVDDDAEVEEDEWNESEREKVLGVDEARRRRKEEEAIRARDKDILRQKRLARERKSKGKAKATPVSEEENEEPVQSGRRKGKHTGSRKNGARALRYSAGDSEHDEEEDSDDLEILDEETVLDQRLRSAKSSVAGKFEAIRAARANRGSSSQQPIVIDSEDDKPLSPKARAPRATYLGQISSEEEQESEESEKSADSDDSQGPDEDDFVVSDEEAGGDDEAAQQELDKLRETMRVKAQGLKYFLKTYLNYLVHLICVPESRWLADEEFKTAKNKIDTHLSGIISSALSSAGWLPKFKRIVDTRPNLSVDRITDTPPCDACAQGKSRRATFVGTFSGAKYNPETLQLLTPSEDESEPGSASSTDSEEEAETDIFGRKKSTTSRRNRRLKSRDKTYEFNLGKHCAGRTEVYHYLRHWPFETKLRLEQKVLPLRDKTIKRAKKKTGMTEAEYKSAIKNVRKKREADASRISTELDRRGVISDLATTLDNELDRAIKAFST